MSYCRLLNCTVVFSIVRSSSQLYSPFWSAFKLHLTYRTCHWYNVPFYCFHLHWEHLCLILNRLLLLLLYFSLLVFLNFFLLFLFFFHLLPSCKDIVEKVSLLFDAALALLSLFAGFVKDLVMFEEFTDVDFIDLLLWCWCICCGW